MVAVSDILYLIEMKNVCRTQKSLDQYLRARSLEFERTVESTYVQNVVIYSINNYIYLPDLI